MMKSRNRNVAIIVAVVVVLACCCALAVAVAGAGIALGLQPFWVERSGPFDLGALYREPVEQTFEVGEAPTLEITNFAGSVTVRAGESDVIRVKATKKASTASRLGDIEVEMAEQGGRVVIRTRKLDGSDNASVDLEITAPASTRLKVDSGAGTIAVSDTSGPVRLSLGAGEITYSGTPAGACSFQTGAGNISLRLPAGSNVEVDLGTALGAVTVGLPVEGRVTLRQAKGVIGDGSQGSITAHTGVGTIFLNPR
jgi:DUF4097 and DUF4098 domain-containing protein YvlB